MSNPYITEMSKVRGYITIVVSQPLLGQEGGFYMSYSPCKAFLDSLQEFIIAVEVLILMVAGL